MKINFIFGSRVILFCLFVGYINLVNAKKSLPECPGIPPRSVISINNGSNCNKYTIDVLRSPYVTGVWSNCNGYILEIYEIVNGLINPNPIFVETKLNPINQTSSLIRFEPNFIINPNKIYQFNLRYKCCNFENVLVIRDTPNICLIVSTLLSAENITCNSARLRWNVKCTNARLSLWYINPLGKKKTFVVNSMDLNGITNYTFNNLVSGRKYYFQMVSRNGCIPPITHMSSVRNFTTLSGTPLPDAGRDTLLECTQNFKLFAKLPSGYTGNWSIVSPTNENGAMFENSNKPNTIFHFGTSSTYTLRWTINGPCGSRFKDIVVSNAFVCGTNYTDPRTNKIYPTKLINGKCWFGKSLDYGAMVNWNGAINYGTSTQDAVWPFPLTNTSIVKYCANNDPANCDTHGALYLGDVAANEHLCPPCWHVARVDEWENLFTFAGNVYDRGSRLSSASPFGFNGISSLPNNPNKELETGFTGFNGLNVCRNGIPFYIGTPTIPNMNGCWDNRSDGDYNAYWTSTSAPSSLNFPNVGAWPNRYNQTRGGVGHYVYFERGPLRISSPPNPPINTTTIYGIQGIKHRRDAAYHVRCVRN